VGTVIGDPRFEGMKRWFLGTADAHELYRQFGFAEVVNPGRFMAIEKSERIEQLLAEMKARHA